MDQKKSENQAVKKPVKKKITVKKKGQYKEGVKKKITVNKKHEGKKKIKIKTTNKESKTNIHIPLPRSKDQGLIVNQNDKLAVVKKNKKIKIPEVKEPKIKVINATKFKNTGKESRSKKIKEGLCIFPFKEKKRGPVYTECAESPNGDWCATSVDDDLLFKTFGFCDYSKMVDKHEESNENSEEMNVHKNSKENKKNNGDIQEKVKNKSLIFDTIKTKKKAMSDNMILKTKNKPKIIDLKKKAKSDDAIIRKKLYPHYHLDDRLIISPVFSKSVEKKKKIKIKIVKKTSPNVKSDKIIPQSWVLPNRMPFNNWITTTFGKYSKKSNNTTCECENKELNIYEVSDNELFNHQRMVRDYMQRYSPYRGILIYHGLGSGKTASSIFIAEDSLDIRDIIVLSPASLEGNYKFDLKKWIYKTEKAWKFKKCKMNNNITQKFQKEKNLSIETMRELISSNNGLWLAINENFEKDTSKYTKYSDLSNVEQISINYQIDKVIENKYEFMHYNSPNFNKKLQEQIDNEDNRFSNKVLIVDEVHNIISFMAGSGSKAGPKLFKLLMEAENCRIVFLSGTPGINSPHEIGILLSILRGYIVSYKFQLSKIKGNWDKEIDTSNVTEILKSIDNVDQVIVDKQTSMFEVTKTPINFSNMRDESDSHLGVKYDTKNNFIEKNNFSRNIIKKLETHGYKNNKKDIEKSYTCLPTEMQEFLDMFVDLRYLDNIKNDPIKNSELFKRRINGLVSYYKGAGEDVFPDIVNPNPEDKVIMVPMSDYQFSEYENARSIERDKEGVKPTKDTKAKIQKPDAWKKLTQKGKPEKTADALFKNTSYYRTFSRQRCNYVFPPEIDRPLKNTIKEVIQNTDFEDAEQNNNAEKIMEATLERAMEELEQDKEKYLSKAELEKCSPKFLRILENIEKCPGSVLVYSSFKTCEGLGILSLVLEAHGFVKYQFKKEDKDYVLDINEGDEDKPKYLSYSGDETEEEKRLLLQAFNSSDNLYGNVVKIFLSSPSGAEGISLSNVRQVNILEPYWHNVRIDQVMGRAVRICSHIKLPKKDQNVEIFIYISNFTKSQISNNTTIQFQDDSKTTDQYILDIANKKQVVMSRIYTLMKEAAFDCEINRGEHMGEDLKCLKFGNKVTMDNNTYGTNLYSEMKDTELSKVEKRYVVEAKELNIRGKKYMLDKNQKTLYDYDSWKSGKTFEIGKIVNKKIVLFVSDEIIEVTDELHTKLFYNLETNEIFNNDGVVLNKFKILKYKGDTYFIDLPKKIIYDYNLLLSSNKLKQLGSVTLTKNNSILIGENIVECKHEETDNYIYFNLDNKTIYDNNGKNFMKLTSTKFKTKEYLYDKKTQKVYDKQELLTNHLLKLVGNIIKTESGKTKIKLL